MRRTVYKSRLSNVWGGVFVLILVFFGLTLPLLIAGTVISTSQALGLGSFWLFGIVLTVVPAGGHLEVGEDYITTYFLGLRTSTIRRSDVAAIRYENLKVWAVPIGKGLKIWRKKRNSLKPKWAFDGSIGEDAFGKEAIADARRALSS